MQALVARVDDDRNRHAALDDTAILFRLGDWVAVGIAIKLDERMAELGHILVA